MKPDTVRAGKKAMELAKKHRMDPRLYELALRESDESTPSSWSES